MSTNIESAAVAVHVWLTAAARRLAADDRGEGVISMGVAVLITAVIGAMMFVGLRLFWEDISATVQRWIDSIGG
ncbi:MAG: DUF6133 family protein [Acidimicrobiales bacterium]